MALWHYGFSQNLLLPTTDRQGERLQAVGRARVTSVRVWEKSLLKTWLLFSFVSG